MEYLGIIEKHLDFILAVFGILFAWWIYIKNIKENKIRVLAKEVIAFYCIEQAAIKMLKEQMSNVSEQTIQRKLRDEAMKNEDNLEGVRPTMSAKGARKYL